MTDGKTGDKTARLRKHVEEVLGSKLPDSGKVMEFGHLVHELQVYQLELEMQNDELQDVTLKLQISRDQYLDLYDFAPVGYLTLDEDGIIWQANLTIMKWLQTPESKLIGQRLSDSVMPQDQDELHLHLSRGLVAKDRPVASTIRLIRQDASYFYVRLDSLVRAADEGRLQLRIALTDVSEQKQAEATIQVYQSQLERLVEVRTRSLAQANEELEQQRRLAETLIAIVADLNSSLDLNRVLERILTNLGQVVQHDTASILLVEEDRLQLARFTGDDPQAMVRELTTRPLHLSDVPHLAAIPSASRQTVVPALGENEKYWLKLPVSDQVRSYICTPIMKDGDLLGILNIESFTPNTFGEGHGKLVQAFVNYAALAIWNVYACVNQQELAVSRERQRIAMELHDAVSQSLWSANMIAESLPSLWQKNKARALEKTQFLAGVTRGIMAEMRALFLEMRPDELESMPLDQSLARLVEAVKSRTELKIDFEEDGQELLPPGVRRTLYRIAQEALNNVARHAHASHVTVKLICSATHVVLTVHDDGRGFDTSHPIPPAHYGLSIMQKRAEEVGAELRIESQPGGGTMIELRYPR
jgi:PAS domain S-box-containing protein